MGDHVHGCVVDVLVPLCGVSGFATSVLKLLEHEDICPECLGLYLADRERLDVLAPDKESFCRARFAELQGLVREAKASGRVPAELYPELQLRAVEVLTFNGLAGKRTGRVRE